jgi:nitrile hydratase subunit beta
VSQTAAHFRAGDRVRVRLADPPGHIRTPFYVRGKRGWIERYVGDFRNPEELAYGRDGLPRRPLYTVGFKQSDVWQIHAESPRDCLYVDIFEHWLEPDGEQA